MSATDTRMNGPFGMYKLQPVFTLTDNIELPVCMYKMKSIIPSSRMAAAPTAVDLISSLEQRQEAILEWLCQLKEQVEKLRLELSHTATSDPEVISSSANTQPFPIPSVGCSDHPAQPTPAVTEGTSVMHVPVAVSTGAVGMPDPVFQSGVLHDVVIVASPSHPPYSLLVLRQLLGGSALVRMAVHVHSSLKSIPENVENFFGTGDVADRQDSKLGLTLIWKEVGCDPEMIISPLTHSVVHGEANIARYLCRLMPSLNLYESGDVVNDTEIDALLDLAHGSLLHGNKKEQQGVLRTLNSLLGKSQWLVGNAFSLADIFMWSVLRQLGYLKDASANLQKWLRCCSCEAADMGGGVEVMQRGPAEKDPGSVESVSSGMEKDKEELLKLLEDLGILTETVDHPEVFTVDAMMAYVKDMPGAVSKNLFLKDKKKNLYLLSAKHDKNVKLNDVAKKIGTKELRFADESVLFEKLGVRQGCVTAYALVNDKNHNVTFLCDSELLDGSHPKVSFHPLSNAATTAVTPDDFKKFLEHTGHDAHLIDLSI